MAIFPGNGRTLLKKTQLFLDELVERLKKELKRGDLVIESEWYVNSI